MYTSQYISRYTYKRVHELATLPSQPFDASSDLNHCLLATELEQSHKPKTSSLRQQRENTHVCMHTPAVSEIGAQNEAIRTCTTFYIAIELLNVQYTWEYNTYRQTVHVTKTTVM